MRIISKNFSLIGQLLVCCVIFVSCGQEDIKKEKAAVQTLEMPYRINIEANLPNRSTVPIGEIGKTIEYVPLETNSGSTLGNINQIEISDSYIFISDFNRLLQFDREGRFIRQVGTNGRGPGEYIYVSGFCIDDRKERVYIIAWGIYSVLEFDYDGNFIRRFDKPFDSNRFFVYDSASFVFNLADVTNITDYSDYRIYFTDTNGIPFLKIKNYNIRTSKPGIMIGNIPFYFYRDSIRYKQFGCDTLYTFNGTGLDPYAIFDLGKLKMDPDPMIPMGPESEEFMERLAGQLWIDKINENERYFFLELEYGLTDSAVACFYDKQLGETTFIEDNGFKNDVDGGLSFWPRYVYNDNVLVDYIEAFRLIDYVNNGDPAERRKLYGEKYMKLESLVGNLDEMSNPIIIILKQKE